MDGKDTEPEKTVTDVTTAPTDPTAATSSIVATNPTIPTSPSAEVQQAPTIETEKVPDKIEEKPAKKKKKKNVGKSIAHFLYNPQRKTVLGRSAINWGKNKFK